MNNNEILEGNKLIAEFDGYPKGLNPDYILKYHTSWDWLMPVVENIRGIENGDGGRYTFNWKDYKVWFSKWQDGSGIISECCMISGTTPIQAIYESVVEFIKWYNAQSKPL